MEVSASASLCLPQDFVMSLDMAGVWEQRSKALRHPEDCKGEESNTGISTAAFELKASTFVVWAVWSHMTIQSLSNHRTV